MFQPSQYNENKPPNNNDSQDRGAILALWGSAISTFGDALQTIGSAISIEEGRIADAQQKQQLTNLQNQIDDLKKEQGANNNTSPDIEKLNTLMEKIAMRLDKDDSKD